MMFRVQVEKDLIRVSLTSDFGAVGDAPGCVAAGFGH